MTMKQSEIKELSVEELRDKMAEFKKQYAEMKVAHSVTPLENPLQLRSARRTVARLATELTKRENQ
ncbi:large subunit ribosomal protein L29 [Zeaxanthinibacter enoshimensis]|uniref:Large ribosomal subunit protein uL29 n=2 Tax=Flavobacteriaceae TaxID=49546 RepID=A0A4R6TFD1_9FLAO|nr:large subunit ribosomal protein L29 [Zeaxanthinibacter enoshimensis]